LSNKNPPLWQTAANNGKVYFFNNFGSVFGQTASQLKTFGENSNI
jgi:hypothetical protein